MDWVTTTIVLEELDSSEDGPAWEQFCRFCHPMIIGFGIKVGLCEHDAQDVAQDTLSKFIELFRKGRYQRQKGGLRKWLMGIARKMVHQKVKKFSREKLVPDSSTGTSFWNSLEDESFIQDTWDVTWHNMILRICLDKIKSEYPKKVYEAFRLFAIKGRPASEVAKQFNRKEGTIFVDKHRILKKLRKLVAEFENDDL